MRCCTFACGFVRVAAAPLFCLCGAIAHAQTPNSVLDMEFAEASRCQLYGCSENNTGTTTTTRKTGIDPCYLKQNALRPCDAKPQAMDAKVVGTWVIAVPGGNWVWEIHPDGTYSFHSEAHDGAPAHSGTFFASNGQWSLRASTGIPGWSDGGQYSLQASSTWITSGRFGTAAWHRRSVSTASK
jgi:hypothetical protein